MTMRWSRRRFLELAGGAAAAAVATDRAARVFAQAPNSGHSAALAPWKRGVKIGPVSDVPGRHTIHTYFNVTPESPDGQSVLFYTSTVPDGQTEGTLVVRDRKTGKERTLVTGLDCEDAHRVACQQWISHGRRVIFHDLREGEVVVVTVDPATKQQRVMARHRMVSFGQQNSDLVPIYGVHFQPDQYRDVELLNAATGEIRPVVKADAIRAAYPEAISKLYGQKPISTPFGTISPDLKLLFVKLSATDDGYVEQPAGKMKWPHSYQSDREGLVVVEVESGKLELFQRDWGHPAWFPDSRRILNYHNTVTDAYTGKTVSIPNLPEFPGQHLTPSPDGKLFVTDTHLETFGGKRGEWGVAVCDAEGGDWTWIAQFQGDQGATTWRKNHPHPAFSPDGKRIYYNVNSGPWTTLHVAERGDA
jgi:hypothetical protein